MKLSLVFATRNNAAAVDKLLGRLMSCERPDDWEVIIIDNGSVDNTPDIIRNYSDNLPLKYLCLPDRGKSKALNYGIRQVMGELILFTDDDVIPDKNWLVNHVRVMQSNPGINVVGGKIRVDMTDFPLWLRRSYNLTGILVSEHDLGDRESTYSGGRYPYGPNLGVRRNVVTGIDRPWPENMGPGTALPVGDEMVFIDRIINNDNELLYSPDCVVEHRPNIPDHFFIKSVRRCFHGGYVSGYYSKHSLVAGYGIRLLKLAGNRTRSCRSIREFICIVSRAAGFFWGRILRRFY